VLWVRMTNDSDACCFSVARCIQNRLQPACRPREP
jgi:hypothetical protein